MEVTVESSHVTLRLIILEMRASVSLTEKKQKKNMLLAPLSSTFLWLLCKVKAVTLRTHCPWLVFTKGSG